MAAQGFLIPLVLVRTQAGQPVPIVRFMMLAIVIVVALAVVAAAAERISSEMNAHGYKAWSVQTL